MKPVIFPILLLAALASAGCSSVKTKVESGPIAARSFSFITTAPKTAPAYVDNRTQIHSMIQEAIKKTFADKGVTYVPNGGDVRVAYLVIAGNNATTVSLNEYFGYSPDATRLLDKVHKDQAIKGANQGYFEAGTLVIDILNASQTQLLKRSSVQSQLLRNLPPDARQARIQSIVNQALSDLRLSK